MQSNKHFLTTAALVVVAMFMLDNPPANADTTWQYVTINQVQVWDGNWNDSAHWTAGVPDNADVAIFPDRPSSTTPYFVTVNITTAAAKTLNMHVDAVINIPADKALEIGNATNQTSDIDGDIVLQGSNSVLRFMFDHTFQPKTTTTGVGQVIGQHNDALIEDDPDTARKLTITNGTGSQMIIQGALKVRLSELANNSLVLANDGTSGSDRLTLDIGTFSGSGTYEVNTANAFLQFTSGITANGLTGPFTVSNGTLDIRDDDVKTDDDLTLSGSGKILVDDGAKFTAG